MIPNAGLVHSFYWLILVIWPTGLTWAGMTASQPQAWTSKNWSMAEGRFGPQYSSHLWGDSLRFHDHMR